MPAYKDKKRGTWYANFYYTDWTGEKKHKCKRGFKLEKKKKKWEKEFLDSLSQSSDITFNSLVENYFKDQSVRLKEMTLECKRAIVDTKLIPYFSECKVCDITPLAINNWQQKMLSYRDAKGNPYSPTYLKTIHSQLSALFNYAIKYYGLSTNPCTIAGAIGKKTSREMNIWTHEEYDLIITYEKKEQYKVALDILFYSGIRIGELLALTPEDILPDMNININKSFYVIKGVGKVTTPKTPRSIRKVAIPEFLYNEVKEYISLLYGIQPDEQIFTFTKSALRYEIHQLAKLSGLHPIRVHDLRHSHVSMLINMGVNIFEISRRLGHESIKTTSDVYGHLYNDKDSKIASKIHDMKKS